LPNSAIEGLECLYINKATINGITDFSYENIESIQKLGWNMI